MKRIVVESHKQLIQILHEEINAGQLSGRQIGVRHFPASKINAVIASGTDRDGQSPIHFDDGDLFSSDVDALAAGVSQNRYPVRPEKVTYMRVVNMDGDQPVSVPLRRNVILPFDSLGYLDKLSSDLAHVLYDPAGLERKSENEFWFRGDPKDAIIAVVTLKHSKK